MRPGLSAYVPVRNGNSLDYCWQLAVQSLLPIADEVVISDGLSTDGTLEEALDWASREPKIRVIPYRWPDPVGDLNMLKKWLNYTRSFLQYDTQITLDADEVLCPRSYSKIRELVPQRKCAWFSRHNLWGDTEHIAPYGTVCGEAVVRMGPTEYEMVSDGFETPEPPIRCQAERYDTLQIFHYGFLRKRAAFFAKSRIVQRAIINSYDSRLAQAEAEGVDWVPLCPFTKPLIAFPHKHPPISAQWLRDRGYSPRT